MSTDRNLAYWWVRTAIKYCIGLYRRGSSGMYPVEQTYLEGFLKWLPMNERDREHTPAD